MARNLGEEMLEYCWENQLEKVKACLTLEVDVNTVSEDGCWSGLTIAAWKNNMELMEIFLSHPNIKINNTTLSTDSGKKFKWTALIFACMKGNSAIVNRLNKMTGLEINYQDEEGDTAAHLAGIKGFTECLRILAQTG